MFLSAVLRKNVDYSSFQYESHREMHLFHLTISNHISKENFIRNLISKENFFRNIMNHGIIGEGAT